MDLKQVIAALLQALRTEGRGLPARRLPEFLKLLSEEAQWPSVDREAERARETRIGVWLDVNSVPLPVPVSVMRRERVH